MNCGINGCKALSLQMMATSVKFVRASPFVTGWAGGAALPAARDPAATFPYPCENTTGMQDSSRLIANMGRERAVAASAK